MLAGNLNDMKKNPFLLLCIGKIGLWSCNDITQLVNIVSPDEKITLHFCVSKV